MPATDTILALHPDWLAVVTGITGAWLVTSRDARRRYWGFVGFLLSNLCWVLWGSLTSTWSVTTVQTVFLLSSLHGMRNNRLDDPPGGR